MARRKTHPDFVREKSNLSERLKRIRTQLFGDRGGPELARRLNLPIRTWYNYESGVTVPAEVVLRFVELTGVDPIWLLRGVGEPFRSSPLTPAVDEGDPHASVRELLREALQRLEERNANASPTQPAALDRRPEPTSDVVVLGLDREEDSRVREQDRPSYIVAHREWMREDEAFRCLRVEGAAMTPIVGDGAIVAYADRVEPIEALDGQMVVARVAGRPIVRWLQLSGHYAMLRAENSRVEPDTTLLELDPDREDHPFRRVLWINTPH